MYALEAAVDRDAKERSRLIMISIQEFRRSPLSWPPFGTALLGSSRRKTIARLVLAIVEEPLSLPWHGFGARGLPAERGTGRQGRREGPPP